MIARIGTFQDLSAESIAESQRNVHERFMPALQAQSGFVMGLWLEGEDGKLLAISVWESKEALAVGAQQANATPLLPGQEAEMIPSPDKIEYFKVSIYAPYAGEEIPNGLEARR